MRIISEGGRGKPKKERGGSEWGGLRESKQGKKGGEKEKERQWGGITKGRRDKEEAKQRGGGKYEGWGGYCNKGRGK